MNKKTKAFVTVFGIIAGLLVLEFVVLGFVSKAIG